MTEKMSKYTKTFYIFLRFVQNLLLIIEENCSKIIKRYNQIGEVHPFYGGCGENCFVRGRDTVDLFTFYGGY